MIRRTLIGLATALTITLTAPAIGNADAVRLSDVVASQVNDCEDGYPVYVDPATGSLYGDQDHDGRLDGDDCGWS